MFPKGVRTNGLLNTWKKWNKNTNKTATIVVNSTFHCAIFVLFELEYAFMIITSTRIAIQHVWRAIRVIQSGKIQSCGMELFAPHTTRVCSFSHSLKDGVSQILESTIHYPSITHAWFYETRCLWCSRCSRCLFHLAMFVWQQYTCDEFIFE